MLKQSTRKKYFLLLILMITLLIFTSFIEARVGGGHGYSGKSRGGNSGNGGSGDGGGDGIFLLIQLIIRHPKIGIPIAIIVVIFIFITKLKNPRPQQLYSSLKSTITMIPLDSKKRDDLVSQLQKEDPLFSLPLFLDFTHLLYTKVIQFAGKHQIDTLNVYLSPPVIEKLKNDWERITEVRDIIIGNCSLIGINLADPEKNMIAINFESNYTVKSGINRNSSYNTYFEQSKWVLMRNKAVISKGPGEMNRIGCPRCGGSLDDNPEEKCSYCGHEFQMGVVTWYVDSITILDRTYKSPEVSGGYTLETGTHLPTIYQPDLEKKFSDFRSKYPAFNVNEFQERVIYIFKALQRAWTTHKWELARPYETDHLFQSHLYWINVYKKEQLRNVLKDIHVSNIQLAKILNDAYYDAITMRIYSSMIDYTETFQGNLIGGDKKHPREFSEYWTFIRKSGQQDTEKKIDQCPNCGNILKIGMVGKCDYCGSKITTGEFSWVLSMIEQDESYTG